MTNIRDILLRHPVVTLQKLQITPDGIIIESEFVSFPVRIANFQEDRTNIF